MRALLLVVLLSACSSDPWWNSPIAGERVGGFYEDAEGKIPLRCNDGSPATGRFSFSESYNGSLLAHYDLCGGRGTGADFHGHHRATAWDGSMDSGWINVDDGSVLPDGSLFAVAAIAGVGYRFLILKVPPSPVAHGKTLPPYPDGEP